METDIHEIGRIPVREVIGELDRILEKNQTEKAETHLLQWLEKADREGDWRAQLTILNELTGLYRSMGKRDEGLEAAERGIRLAESHGMENAVTTMTAFGRAEEAMTW